MGRLGTQVPADLQGGLGTPSIRQGGDFTQVRVYRQSARRLIRAPGKCWRADCSTCRNVIVGIVAGAAMTSGPRNRRRPRFIAVEIRFRTMSKAVLRSVHTP